MFQLQGEINPWTELLWFCLGRSDFTLPSLMLGLAEKFVMKETELHRRFVRRGETLRQELNTLLGEDGVLLYPSHPSPAPYHNHLLLKPFNFAYTGIFNILGNPVTQVNLYILSPV